MSLRGFAASVQCYISKLLYRFDMTETSVHLKTMRYFVAIADSGSFTAASQAVSIAQPALTRQIRDLEDSLGAQLLQRTTRGVRLTPAGVTFYESAQRILAESQRMRQELSRSEIADQSVVVLGTPPTLARVMIPGLFERITEPMISLKTREAFTPTLLDWLDRGVIDMAVLTNPDPRQGLNFRPLVGESFVLASHPSMRVGGVVSVNQLARTPLVMTSLHRGLVERQLLSLGKRLNVVAEIDSVDAIREMVMDGKWATIMPVSVFKDFQKAKKVVLSEISGVQLTRLLVLGSRNETQMNSSQVVVQNFLKSEFARLVRLGVFSLSGVEPSMLN